MVSITAVGDLMLGDHPVCFGHGIRSTIRKKGFDFLVSEVQPYLKDADICFGNLETVLSDVMPGKENILHISELRGDSRFAHLLSEAGFNIVNVANNHILQHGEEAFKETIDSLDSAGISYTGIKASEGSNVHYFEKDKVRIVFLGYSLRPEKFTQQNNLYANSSEEEILRQVKKTKCMNPETIIFVSLHWGEEYLNYPSASQIDFAHKLIDSGCTVIIGHHPHVLQGIEEYKSGLIFYSLGNFIFDKWQRNSRETVIVKIYLHNNGIESYHIIPVFIRKDYSLSVRDTINTQRIKESIWIYSSAISERNAKILEDTEYASHARKAYLRFRLLSYGYFMCNLWRYKPSVILQSLQRSLSRRLGSNG